MDDQALAKKLAELLEDFGPRVIIRDAEPMAPYLSEPRGLHRGKAAALARPRSEAEAARVLKALYDKDLAIIPQGGNTGLVGGQMPFDGRGVILSTEGLRERAEMSADGATVTLSSGYRLEEAQALASAFGRRFPLRIGSQGSCMIGGNLATNAGGAHVVAYGMTRDLVLSLEAILPNGASIGNLSALKKDNSGYDIKNLLIGSEGTLALITAATFRLCTEPEEVTTLLAAFETVNDALAFSATMQKRFDRLLSASEWIPGLALDLVRKHFPHVVDPMRERHEHYLLMELSSPLDISQSLHAHLEAQMAANGVKDLVIASNQTQVENLWGLRESINPAQKREGGLISHDISVPQEALASFVQASLSWVASLKPPVRPLVYGHAGDGNLHFNLLAERAMESEALASLREQASEGLYAIVLSHRGSLTAEHGMGRFKARWLTSVRHEAEINLYRSIKKAFDPKGLMNPGVILSAEIADPAD